MNSTESSNTYQTLWLGIGSLFTLMLGLCNVGILSRYLPKEEYGTYKQIIYVYNFMLTIFSAGLPSAYSYFLPRLNPAQGKKLINKLTIALFILGLFFSLTLFLGSSIISKILKNPELEHGIRYFAIIPLLMMPTLGIQGIYLSIRKSNKLAFYNAFTSLIMVAFIVLPVMFFKANYLNAIFGWIISSIISFFLAMYLQYKPYKGTSTENSNVEYKKVFNYSVPIMVDTFFISRYYGQTVFAEFSNGFIELPFVGMITGSAAAVLLPVFSKHMEIKNNLDSVVILFKNALRKSALLIYPLLIYCLLFSKVIILSLYGHNYSNSAIYFRIALTINFFNVLMFSPIIFAMGATKTYSEIHLLIALGVWISELLVVLIINSPYAIAIVSVSFAIIKIFLLFIFISRKLEIKLSELIPFVLFVKIIFHSLIIAWMLNVLFTIYLLNINGLFQLAISFLSFSTILLFTEKYFKLDYLEPIKPLFDKFKQS
jgi:O-antigen/teichoic acid export membrane protein